MHNLYLSRSELVLEIPGNKRVTELLHTFVKGLKMKAYFTKPIYNKANMIYTCPARTFLKGTQAKMESIFPGHTSAYEYNHKGHNFSSDVIFFREFPWFTPAVGNNFFPKIWDD